MTVYLFDAAKQVRKIIPQNGVTELIHDEAAHILYATVSMDYGVANGEHIGLRCIDEKFRLFTVTNSENKDDNRTTIITATDAIVQELKELIVEEKQQLDTTLTDAINGLLDAAGVKNDWNVTGEQPEKTEKSRAYFTSVWDMLESYKTLYGWQIIPYYTFFGRSISGRVIELKEDKAEFRGRILTSKKDASNVYVIKKNPPYTRLYGIGPATGSRDVETNMNFADVSWSVSGGKPADKPKGQAWVEDPDAVAKYGRHTAVIQINEVENAEQLLEKTWEQLQKLKEPSCTVEATIQDLERVPGYENQVLRLGDLVPIRLSNATMEAARVIGIKRNYIQHWLTKIVIGDKEATIQSQVSGLIAGAAHTFERLTIYQNRFREDEALIQLNAEFVQANAEAIELNAKEIRANAELIALKAEKSTVDGLSTQTAELQVKHDQISAKVEDNEGNISTLTQTVNGFHTRIEDAEGQVAEFGNTVNGLTSRVEDAEGQVSEFENTIAGLRNTVTNNTGDISTLTNTVNGLSSRVEDAEESVSEFENTIAGLRNTVTNNTGSISTLTNTVSGLKSRVEDAEGQVSEFENTIAGLRNTVTNNTGDISTLTNTVSGLSSRVEDAEGQVSEFENTIAGLRNTVTNNKGDISTLTNTVSGLTSRVEDAEGNITTLQTTSAGFETRVKNAEDTVASLSVTVGEQGSRIDAQAETISLKASQETVDDMDDRLSYTEMMADAALSWVKLKADLTLVEGLDKRLTQAEVDIDGANAQIALKASLETVEGLAERVSEAEVDINAAEAAIALKANQSTVDSMNTRLSQAEVDIDGLDARIDLIATESDVTELAERVSQAEAKIDGAEASIALKANQSTVTAMESRLSQAELDIDGANAAINLKASQSSVTALGNRVSSAELRIDGAESAITAQAETIALKASQDDLDDIVLRLDAAEDEITAQAGTIAAKANRTELQTQILRIDAVETEITGLLKVTELQAAIADLSDVSVSSLSVGGTAHCTNLSVHGAGSVDGDLSVSGGLAIGGESAATQAWVQEQGYANASALGNYALRSWVIENYARSDDVSQTMANFVLRVELDGYATQAWVRENFSKASTTYKPTVIERYGDVSGTSIPVQALNESGTVLLTGTVDAGDVYNTGWNDCRQSATSRKVLVNYYAAGETLYDADGNVATGPWYKGTETYLYALPAAKP